MTKEQLAEMLNGGEYPFKLTTEEAKTARESGLVVVYGASDDLMEFQGSINDELGAYNGTIAYLNGDGLLENPCDNDACPYFLIEKAKAIQIRAIWDKDGYSFMYETEIPHATFEVMEEGEKYCRGIVFSMADLRGE